MPESPAWPLWAEALNTGWPQDGTSASEVQVSRSDSVWVRGVLMSHQLWCYGSFIRARRNI